ncbi:MAG: hypothetical protein V1710_04845 [Candidatus Bathyarchaeota archaeon]
MSVLASVVSKVGKVLEEMATDLSELSVVTTTGSITTIEVEDRKRGCKKQVFDVEETGISAKTVIQIDGDIIVKIPVRDVDGNRVEIDERMLQLHEENVKMAMENWRTIITTLVSVVKELQDIVIT